MVRRVNRERFIRETQNNSGYDIQLLYMGIFESHNMETLGKNDREAAPLNLVLKCRTSPFTNRRRRRKPVFGYETSLSHEMHALTQLSYSFDILVNGKDSVLSGGCRFDCRCCPYTSSPKATVVFSRGPTIVMWMRSQP